MRKERAEGRSDYAGNSKTKEWQESVKFMMWFLSPMPKLRET